MLDSDLYDSSLPTEYLVTSTYSLDTEQPSILIEETFPIPCEEKLASIKSKIFTQEDEISYIEAQIE
jgi:hypothetical protein